MLGSMPKSVTVGTFHQVATGNMRIALNAVLVTVPFPQHVAVTDTTSTCTLNTNQPSAQSALALSIVFVH